MSGAYRMARRLQHDRPIVPLDAVTAQGNYLGVDGAEALLPALEKLTSLTVLNLSGTCGYMQRRNTQCARVGGGAGERAGQVVVMVCDGLFACELCGFWPVLALAEVVARQGR